MRLDPNQNFFLRNALNNLISSPSMLREFLENNDYETYNENYEGNEETYEFDFKESLIELRNRLNL